MDPIQSNNDVPFKITGNWYLRSKLLKAQYSQLTNDDLKFENGKENELLTRIENRLNKKREEVIDIIKESDPEKNSGLLVK